MSKYSQEMDNMVWEKVVAYWAQSVKYKSLNSVLARARRQTLGMTGTLVNHVKRVEAEKMMMLGRHVTRTNPENCR